MPTRVIARKRRVPGISFAWQITRENKSMFCEYNYGIHKFAARAQATGCIRIQ